LKKIKIDIADLMVVLEAMVENGTKEIIFFEYNEYPAIADADDPDGVITFQSVNEKGEVNEEDETVH
jgi:hypothetical protein